MARFLCPATVLVVLVCVASPARAEVPSRCRELFIESRFSAAQQCFEQFLIAFQGQPSQLAEGYAFLAAILAARNHDDDALGQMQVVLALEPGWEPSDPLLTSPKVLELLSSARASFDVPSESPSLRPGSLPSGLLESDELVVDTLAPHVGPPLEVVLMVRRRGEGSFGAVSMGGAASEVRVARVQLEPGEGVEYYLAVRTPEGWIAFQRGSEEEPFSVEREPRQVDGGGGGGGGGGPGPGPGGDPGLGRRLWWVWTILGVAVVGSTVGLAVGLTSGGDETGSVRLHFP